MRPRLLIAALLAFAAALLVLVVAAHGANVTIQQLPPAVPALADTLELQAAGGGSSFFSTLQQLLNAASICSAAATPAGADKLLVTQSGVAKAQTFTALQAAFGASGALPLSGYAAAGAAPAAHAASHQPGGGDAMAVDAAAGTGSLRTLGTGAAQAAAGNDSRMSDPRTPTAHAASHKNAGSDEVATATPGANAIPKAGGAGTLDPGWIPTLPYVPTSPATGTGSVVQATSPTLTTPSFSGAIGSDFDLGTHADVYEIANEGATGTTVNKLAKLTGAPSTAILIGTGDTSGISGVVVAGAGTTGNALLARAGRASCVFDGATTAGDYVQASATVAGDCHDAGASLPTANQILGRVLSTNGSGGTFAMTVYSPGIIGSGASGANAALSNLSGVAINIPLATGAGVAFSATTTAAAATASTTAGVGMTFTADNAVAGTTNAGAQQGGDWTATAGDAARFTSGNARGGACYLIPGAGIGTGSAGGIGFWGKTSSFPGFKQRSGSAQIQITDATWANRQTLWMGAIGVGPTMDNFGSNDFYCSQTGNSGTACRVSSGNSWGITSGADASQSPDVQWSRQAAKVSSWDGSARGDHLGWNNWGGECYVAADATNATTTMAAITCGTNITVTSGRKYTFECELFLSDSTSVDGAKIDFNGGTAAATNFRAQVTAFDTALNLSSQPAALATASSASTFTGAGAFEVHGSFEPSSTGTFIPEFAQAAHTTGTLTLARGSFCRMYDSP